MAQSISGAVYDEHHNPIPFANIFIRELNTGVSADDQGRYFLTITPRVYNLIVSSVGYKTTTAQIVVKDEDLVQDFVLESTDIQLEEIVVKVNRKDPAYEIIRNAIDNKDKFLSQVLTYKTNVYVKATEVVDDKKKKEKLARELEEEEEDLLESGGPPIDPFAKQRKKEQALLESINMLEMQLVLNFQFPDHYKEERTAYKAFGQKEGLYIPVFSETDFNFYHNLVDLKGIAEVPLISPLSSTAMLSYKFKLEETLQEAGGLVYKIRVTPRKKGNATCEGFIYINDDSWNINRLDLALDDGGLKFYDAFTIKQSYKNIEGDLWIPSRQEFNYHTKVGSKSFEGNTVLSYADFQKDFPFPDKFFGNEVSVITREAYERDSSYWNSSRPEPLTLKQQKLVSYRDSIEAAHNDKAYLDSIETQFNKVRLGEVMYHGMEFRSETRKSHLFITPVLGMIDFEVIGGFRLGPYASYFKRFESGRTLHTSGYLSVGFKNKDVQGNFTTRTRYNPYKLGDATLKVGRSFASINNFDAYINQLRVSNYILHDHLELLHRIELFNGFYLGTDLGYHMRQSIENYNRSSIINTVIKEDDPMIFQDYNALISNIKISYTPMQRYMTEPNQKVVLGSKYPTFSLIHKKGWDAKYISDIDFDYLELSMEQDLQLGTLGNSKYNLKGGKFVNSRDLRFVDIKRFRQSDPYLYSNPLHSFQLLDTALVSTGLFLEAHYIHHFNGAMINNLPLIKKLKIRTLAGAGAMWFQESNFRHQEVFAGVERIFKVGARRRLRVGLFGVLSQSNVDLPKSGFKISFDIIDTWKRDWSY